MRALITGRDQGIGLAIGNRLLMDENYSLGFINGGPLKKAALNNNLKESIEGWLSMISQPFDIIINNYAINHLSWIGETPEEDRLIMELNVMAPYWIINRLAKRQRDHPTRVINIASQTHRIPQRCTALYSASKAALVQMTKVMARELAPAWQINCVSPGKVEGTRMTELTDAQVLDLRGWDADKADNYARSMIPMERFTTVDEVAETVMKVLDLPSYVTGTNIEVMGGV